MSYRTKNHFAYQLVFALAVMLIATQNLTAQSGGAFNTNKARPPIAKSQGQFNSTPFRITGAPANPAAPPIVSSFSSPKPTVKQPTITPSPFGAKRTAPPTQLKSTSNSKSFQPRVSSKPFTYPNNRTGSSTSQGLTRPTKATPVSTQLPGHPSNRIPVKPVQSFSDQAQQAKSGVQNSGVKTILPGQLTPTSGRITPMPQSDSFAKPTSFGTPTQGRPNFSGSNALTPQITSGESNGGSSRLPDYVDCPTSTVNFIDDINLPAKEAGEITELNFEEGDFVPAGQSIGRIDDAVYQMALDSAKMKFQIAFDKANNKVASMGARKKWEVARIEAAKTSNLAAKGSKSASEKRMADYTKDIAYLEMQKTDDDRRIALAEAQLARAEMKQVQQRIARHNLSADFDAYVVKILKKKQEYVQMGEEVMRLARMDRVWVQSVVSYEKLNAHELKGRKVTITVKLARDEETTFDGVIKFVGLERQGPKLLMIKAEVVNRAINDHWVLHPEAQVEMRIHVTDPPFGSSARVTR